MADSTLPRDFFTLGSPLDVVRGVHALQDGLGGLHPALHLRVGAIELVDAGFGRRERCDLRSEIGSERHGERSEA